MTKLKKYSEVSDYWLAYKDALRHYIFKKVKDADTADELAHQTLMKVYSSCCSGREIRNIRSWLFQIAYNTCMDYFNARSKISELNGDFPQVHENRPYREASEFIEPLLGLLPEKYAKPLKLADIDGWKQNDVAADLSLSLTATKSRIQRARKLLKEQIKECLNIEVDQMGRPMAFYAKDNCEVLQTNCWKG